MCVKEQHQSIRVQKYIKILRNVLETLTCMSMRAKEQYQGISVQKYTKDFEKCVGNTDVRQRIKPDQRPHLSKMGKRMFQKSWTDLMGPLPKYLLEFPYLMENISSPIDNLGRGCLFTWNSEKYTQKLF